MAARLFLVIGGVCVGLLLGEGMLWSAGRPPIEPFLQEFYADRFKIMCFDSNPSGSLDVDLRDPQHRERYETIFLGGDSSVTGSSLRTVSM